MPFQHNDDDWRQFPDDNALDSVALGLAARAVPATVARHALFLAEVQQTALTDKQRTDRRQSHKLFNNIKAVDVTRYELLGNL